MESYIENKQSDSRWLFKVYYVRISNEVYWFLATIDDHQFRERFEESVVATPSIPIYV